MRFRLRTLLIVLAVAPIILAALWFACQPQFCPPARVRIVTPNGITSIPNPDYPPRRK